MTARRVLSLLSLAVCAAALVGCGGDTLSFDPVANAASTTVASQSERVSFTATMNVDGVGGMAFSGAGIFDGRSRSGALNMRFTLPAAVQAQLGGADPTMQMIMDGRHGLVMYMRSPLFRTLATDKWINFTTHYTLKVDLERLAKGNKELRTAFEMLRKLTGAQSFPAEAWIDDQGRVRRIKLDMSFNGPTGGAFTMSMTEDLYAFGVKVNVQPPDASQVLDASALLGG